MAEIKTVSIVTPSYNQGEFIEETIKSVLSQAGDFYIEYLIMDGGSKDNTVEIIKKYERLLKEGGWPVACRGIEYIWVSERDKGQSDAVNKGFRRAKGEILGWLNSDDTYLPGAIETVLERFKADKDLSMCYGEGYHTDRSGKVIERYYTEPFDFKRLRKICFICQPTVFLGRNVLNEAGYLDAALDYCMDYEYWIRIAKKGLKTEYTPRYLATSRMYADNKTLSKKLEVHAETIRMIQGHYGSVPITWVAGYFDALMEKGARSWVKKTVGNYLYGIMRGGYVRYKCFRLNGALPAKEDF